MPQKGPSHSKTFGGHSVVLPLPSRARESQSRHIVGGRLIFVKGRIIGKKAETRA